MLHQWVHVDTPPRSNVPNTGLCSWNVSTGCDYNNETGCMHAGKLGQAMWDHPIFSPSWSLQGKCLRCVADSSRVPQAYLGRNGVLVVHRETARGRGRGRGRGRNRENLQELKRRYRIAKRFRKEACLPAAHSLFRNRCRAAHAFALLLRCGACVCFPATFAYVGIVCPSLGTFLFFYWHALCTCDGGAICAS